MDCFVSLEEAQIAGHKFLIDLSSFNAKQLSQFEGPGTMFTLMRNWQDAFPVRNNGAIFWKPSKAFEVLYTFMKTTPIIKKKLKGRVSYIIKNIFCSFECC